MTKEINPFIVTGKIEPEYSVAVENATDHVKSVAHTICGHHNDDGVAHWIEDNLL